MRSAKPHPVSKSSRDAAPARPFPPYDARRYVVSQSVGHQIVNLMTLMRRELETRMAAVGLTDAQWKPLWMLDSGRADTGKLTISESYLGVSFQYQGNIESIPELQAPEGMEYLISSMVKRPINLPALSTTGAEIRS